MAYPSPGDPIHDKIMNDVLDQIAPLLTKEKMNNYSAELCRRLASIGEQMKTSGLKWMDVQKNKGKR